MAQFLLNPDGTTPNGFDPAYLISLGLTLVLPTQRHTPRAGHVLREGVAVDGKQVWIEEPEPEPEPAGRPDLRSYQFRFLLAQTNLEEAWSAAKGTDLDQYARKTAEVFKERIKFAAALEITGLPEAELAELWDKAAGI